MRNDDPKEEPLEVSPTRRDLFSYGAAAAGVLAASGSINLLTAAPWQGQQFKGFRAELDADLGTAVLSSPATFGTSYHGVGAAHMFPLRIGTYSYADMMGQSRYPVSGDNQYYSVPLDIPNGTTITELEFTFLHDLPIGTVIGTLFRFGLHSATAAQLGFVASSARSASPQTMVATITPHVVDRANYVYAVGFRFAALNDPLNQFIGARVGYTGRLGTLLMLPSSDRYVDTRPGANNRGGLSAPFTNVDNTFDFTVTGVAGRDGNVVPTGATAIVGNVTAVAPSTAGLFKILPGETPTATGSSTVNFNAGFTTANGFTVRLNDIGQVRAYYSGTGQADLLLDIAGYYLP